MSLFRQLAKSATASLLPPTWLMTRCPSPDDALTVALTFDDGPHPEHTPRLLDVLAEIGVSGTFFVVGEHASRHPRLIQRILQAGHAIGNHTWSHSEPSKTSATQFINEVRQTRQLIQDVTGQDCRLMRPPKGKLTLAKTIGLWREQQTIVLWNVDPKDFAMCDDQAMHRWIDGYACCRGDIVLLHDNHPRAAVAVQRMNELCQESCQFVTISPQPTGRANSTMPVRLSEVQHAR